MNRTFLVFLVFMASLAGLPSVSAADPALKPVLRVNLESESAVPGQVIILDVTILVPTWMLEPPELPTVELPDVRVQLPEGASRPAMEKIDGETWSGVTRGYQISPMAVGQYRIPPQNLVVTYADPETQEPIVVTLRTPEVSFEGTAPQGAEGLDPFIAATDLVLDQRVEGDDPSDLEPGRAFTRIVTARIEGASPMFLPPLISALEVDGIAAYPKEPVFAEGSNRGSVTGERVESVTYVAEAGGRFEAPPIALRWWNLRTKEIEVSEVPGLEIVSRGPPASALPVVEPGERGLLFVLGGVLLALCLVAGRWIWPRIAERREHGRRVRLASEAWAFEQITSALEREHLGDAMRSVEVWAARCPELSAADLAQFYATLEQIGADLYGSDPRSPSKEHWANAMKTIREIRRSFLSDQRRSGKSQMLPSLNPSQAGARRG